MKKILFALILPLMLAGCDVDDLGRDADQERVNAPKAHKYERKDSRGSLVGEGGLFSLGGDKDEDDGTGKSGIAVNSFLWRATLDTLAFMPITSADPFGGTVFTDWYEDPAVAGERFKVNALILTKTLRADGIKMSVFKQKQEKGQWRDQPVDTTTARKLEDAVLTRARELRIKSQK